MVFVKKKQNFGINLGSVLVFIMILKIPAGGVQ